MMRVTVGATITLTLLLMGMNQWQASIDAEQERARWQQANERAGVWMDDTSAKLERINEGVERITGELVEIAQRVDNLESRL